MAMYTYTPKMGDVVRFPNGIEVNYSDHDQRLVVTHPDPDMTFTLEDRESEHMLLIGASK